MHNESWTTGQPRDMICALVTDSGLPMPKANRLSSAAKIQAYRERIRAAGAAEVLVQLPREMVALIDALKEREGLQNRSQALLQLIERGREATQQVA